MAANSTGAVGKMLRYPQHNRGKGIIFSRYYFAQAGYNFNNLFLSKKK